MCLWSYWQRGGDCMWCGDGEMVVAVVVVAVGSMAVMVVT